MKKTFELEVSDVTVKKRGNYDDLVFSRTVYSWMSR